MPASKHLLLSIDATSLEWMRNPLKQLLLLWISTMFSAPHPSRRQGGSQVSKTETVRTFQASNPANFSRKVAIPLPPASSRWVSTRTAREMGTHHEGPVAEDIGDFPETIGRTAVTGTPPYAME